MLFHHVANINKNEKDALAFYQDFLGLKKVREYTVSPQLGEQLFSLSREMNVITFEKENVRIEIFICPDFNLPSPNIPHFALHFENFNEFLDNAKKAQVPIITGMKKDKKVYFIKDYSGNLIEVKQA
jgi:catechol 2,3-dioxygenase-like lactoylglutathione lyase family enzyme